MFLDKNKHGCQDSTRKFFFFTPADILCNGNHSSVCMMYYNVCMYSRRHKKVPVPYSYYDRKTLRSVKRYDPITVQIVITIVLFIP